MHHIMQNVKILISVEETYKIINEQMRPSDVSTKNCKIIHLSLAYWFCTTC